jgi:hypothetical protein
VVYFDSECRSTTVRVRGCRERLLHVEVPLLVAIQHLPVVHVPPPSTEQAAALQTTCESLIQAGTPVVSVLLQSRQHQSGVDGRAVRRMMVCAAGHDSSSLVAHH